MTGERIARAGPRQTIRVQFPDSPQACDSKSRVDEFAVLQIKAIRPGTFDRSAKVYLSWDGEKVGYQVVGLEH